MSCKANFTSVEELIHLVQDPNLNLTAFVTGCTKVCSAMYGKGNPDLGGIGMIVYYMLQVALSLLFGPVLLINFLISAFRGHEFNRFMEWLTSQQEFYLFSQLLFTLVATLACFMYLLQRDLWVYETSLISTATGINCISLLITVSTFYQRIRRMILFVISVAGTVVFTIYSVHRHEDQLKKLGEVMQVCTDLERLQLPSPHAHGKAGPPLLVNIFLVLVLIVMWFFLWWRRKAAKFTTDFENNPYTRAERVIAPFVFVFSMALWALAVSFLVGLMKIRHALRVSSNNGTGENEWGVGQIVALFAWGPLLVEMAYNADRLWKRGGDDESQQNASDVATQTDMA